MKQGVGFKWKIFSSFFLAFFMLKKSKKLRVGTRAFLDLFFCVVLVSKPKKSTQCNGRISIHSFVWKWFFEHPVDEPEIFGIDNESIRD